MGQGWLQLMKQFDLERIMIAAVHREEAGRMKIAPTAALPYRFPPQR